MTCKCGNYTRFLNVQGKCSDLSFTSVPHLKYENDGYAPHIPGLGGGDYIEVQVCLNCGLLQGFKAPYSDEDLKTTLEIEDEEHEELDENLEALIAAIAEIDMLRWTGREVANVIKRVYTDFHDEYRIDLLEHFLGANLWYKNEILQELNDRLDLQNGE